ncbi:MAG: DUF4041 domain-containing protein [Clostridiaceae bacterium]
MSFFKKLVVDKVADIGNELLKPKSSDNGNTGPEKKGILSSIIDNTFEQFGLYTPKYNAMSSVELSELLNQVRLEQKKSITRGEAYYVSKDFTFNGSKSKGLTMLKNEAKLMLRAFNTECEAAINKVTYSTYDAVKERIKKSFEEINKITFNNLSYINKSYLDLKLKELELAFKYEEQKQTEKEILREQKEREKEEKKVQIEIARKKKAIEKELTHLENLKAELELKLITASDAEKISILAEMDKLRESIDAFQDEQEDLDYRIENLGAGYVYVISNIGAFGNDIYKIGVTRRLDPEERINELSNASVPFKFDVHALVFSYQAYELETALHNKFSKNRLNLINNRKEYFRVPLSEIKEALSEYKDLTFDFIEEPDASEYRESIKIAKG